MHLGTRRLHGRHESHGVDADETRLRPRPRRSCHSETTTPRGGGLSAPRAAASVRERATPRSTGEHVRPSAE